MRKLIKIVEGVRLHHRRKFLFRFSVEGYLLEYTIRGHW